MPSSTSPQQAPQAAAGHGSPAVVQGILQTDPAQQWGRVHSAAHRMGQSSSTTPQCVSSARRTKKKKCPRDVGSVKAARVDAAMSELLRPSASASGRHTETVATGSSYQVQHQCGQLTSEEGCHRRRNNEETCASMGRRGAVAAAVRGGAAARRLGGGAGVFFLIFPLRFFHFP